jgi:hypothetical protein
MWFKKNIVAYSPPLFLSTAAQRRNYTTERNNRRNLFNAEYNEVGSLWAYLPCPVTVIVRQKHERSLPVFYRSPGQALVVVYMRLWESLAGIQYQA